MMTTERIASHFSERLLLAHQSRSGAVSAHIHSNARLRHIADVHILVLPWFDPEILWN
jgi:hypothetical protein